ncbi:MAG: hypothetical protein JWQ51_1227, partial [Tardiphaga sp.]|nr:hypothetical protein [Tardiphaga sp.]
MPALPPQLYATSLRRNHWVRIREGGDRRRLASQETCHHGCALAASGRGAPDGSEFVGVSPRATGKARGSP